jgi:hypothetical protein
MKTMTCKQMGGPCDFAMSGENADVVIKAQDKHIREKVAEGDATHQTALDEMNARWKNPVSGMKWYMKMKSDFAALAED